MADHIDIPSNPADQKAIQEAIQEMAKALKRIADEQDYIKSSCAALKDKFGLTPKLTKALATALHKHNYPEKQKEFEDFEAAYEILVEGRRTQ